MNLVPIADTTARFCVNPVQFGYEDCERGHSFGPAVRTFYLIHYVVSGCGQFTKGENTYNIRAGEMFVISPLEETFYKADEKNPWSYIWIGFESDFLPFELADKVTCPEAVYLFSDMKKCEEFKSGRKLFLTAKILELFALLEKSQKSCESYSDMAKSFMESEYMTGVGIEDIAKRLGLNRSYFSDIFKKEVGMSPLKYLTQCRMIQARKLLENSKKSVAVVAHSVGYSDTFTFSKAFKKYWGISPAFFLGNKN